MYKCIIFDLDGTIYFGNQIAYKANEVIAKAREKSHYVFFMTNNSAQTREQVYNKLIKIGIKLNKNELVTSSYAIAKYLKENNYKEIYCLGTESLKNEIEQLGITTVSEEPQAIIVGYNPDFKLSDLNDLCNINISNAKLIIANRERYYPKENRYIVPGLGPIVAAVENVIDKQADIIIGKPNIEMLKIIIPDSEIKADDICIIGDSYESDIKMANNYGAKGILITQKQKDNCICINKLADLLEMWHD